MKPPEKILVLGGSGFVGRSICARLAARSVSAPLVVPTRRPAHADHLRSLPTVEVIKADVHDEAQLAQLVAGSRVVINLVAILHGSKTDFDRAHVELPRRLARACVAAGVRRIIHVSALGVGPDAPSNYLRSKTAGEAALISPTLDVTVLRPSVIFGADDRFMNVFAALQAVAPVMPLAAGAARFQPVWVDDVAQAVVRCVDERATIGKTYECVGPEICTLSEIVRLAGRWSGHERLQIALPRSFGRLQALLLECLPGQPLMSRDNLDSMTVANVASGRLPGLPALGIAAMALDAVAPGYLGSRQDCARLDSWRALARRE